MPETVTARLRDGLPLDDADFDRLYPDWAQGLSHVHWTPVAVARRAAQLLVTNPGTRVLDVGAGVGKFCLVGALSSAGVFYGIEHRSQFVRVAREAAARLGLPSRRFLHGNLLALDWAGFDAFYLYNPFAENLTSGPQQVDEHVYLAPGLFHSYVEHVRERLHLARRGTRVVTYHGFGGDMPSSYRLELEEACGTERVELWIKDDGAAGT
jgi:SAM-dependent methyltransferase